MGTDDMDLEQCLEMEREARAAAASSANVTERDEHVMRAERLADRAWHLEEHGDHDYHPSGLWTWSSHAAAAP